MTELDGPAAFTVADNWHGGFYELAIEVGPRNDKRLDRVLRAVWAAAGVRGCYARRDVEPSDQPAVPCEETELVAHGHLRGLVTLPSGIEMVCGAVAIREDDGLDWLDFFVPLGALGRADARVGRFPFGLDGGPGSLGWRRPIDDWLVDVGRQVHARVDYQLAVVGFEASGQVRSSELAAGQLPSGWAYAIPDRGLIRYLPART